MDKIQKHFDHVAKDYDNYKTKNKFYYDNLKELLVTLIPPHETILEIGCGTGDLLANLNPRKGFGIDISSQMIKFARSKHKSNKNLSFSTQSIIKFKNKKIDNIFMSDVIEHLENPQQIFNQISQVMDKNTVFINTMANPKWESVLMLAEKMGKKMPEGDHDRIDFQKIQTIIKNSNLQIVDHKLTLLLPIKIPYITTFVNRFLEPYLKPFCFIEYFVVKKKG